MISAVLALTVVGHISSPIDGGVLRALVLCEPETRAQRLLDASSTDEEILGRLGLKRIDFGKDFIAVDVRIWAPPELASRWALLQLMAKSDGRSIAISSLPEAIRDAAVRRANRNLRFVDSTATITNQDSIQLVWQVQVKVATASGEHTFTLSREPRRDFTPQLDFKIPEGIGQPGMAKARPEFSIQFLKGEDEPTYWDTISAINRMIGNHRAAMDKVFASAQAGLMRRLFGDLPDLSEPGIPFGSLPRDIQTQLKSARNHLSDAESETMRVSSAKGSGLSPMFVFSQGGNQTLLSAGALISPP